MGWTPMCHLTKLINVRDCHQLSYQSSWSHASRDVLGCPKAPSAQQTSQAQVSRDVLGCPQWSHASQDVLGCPKWSHASRDVLGCHKWSHASSLLLPLCVFAGVDDIDLELRLARFEELMDRRPFLLSR